MTFESMQRLSPRRNSTKASDVGGLVDEQLVHFGIDAGSEFGQTLARVAGRIYETQGDLDAMWALTLKEINGLDHADRIARFNAKKFLSFQLAKLLDTLQHSFRRSYQSLDYTDATELAKGPYPVFDNITAIFSATPVIARTATYIYACAEWIEEAFRGRELMLEIYSRLLNPTSISLANYVVDLECGPYSGEYLAWNFNSGMAAIDSTLSHVLGRDDVLITSRNIYGGAWQLIHDWFAKPSNLAIAVETFDGYDVDSFAKVMEATKEKYADRLAEGRKIYVYLESPCNPHGYVLDVPAICKVAHENGMRVMLDATVGTPFLHTPLQREDSAERPDYVIHSYTKDLTGTGSAIAGGVIAKNEDMFAPKGSPGWEHTMFWNVYYVKGAFLNADASFEVIQGMRTLADRMLKKCINTRILAQFMAAHPAIDVNCNALEGDENYELNKSSAFIGLPSPLFTTSMGTIPREPFLRFFDMLSPTFGHMISLGQSNTIVSCPALTTHSELDEEALAASGLTPTTIRFAIGDENPIDLIRHLVETAKVTIDLAVPGFSDGFPKPDEFVEVIRETYVAAHRDYISDRLEGVRS